MIRKVITPTDKEHWLQEKSKVLSSTEISALFGINPWQTKFELWHAKRHGTVTQIEDNDRMFWGRWLEPGVAAGAADKRGWVIRPMKEFITLPELRLGASFDYRILTGDEDTEDDSILEIKNIDYRVFQEGWIIGDEDEMEAPPAYEMQIQHQLLVSGLKQTYLACLVSGNDIRFLRREADPEIHESILARAKAFWESVDNDRPPEPEFPRDADMVSRLYSSANKEKVVEASHELEELAFAYDEARERRKQAEDAMATIKAKILMQAGDAGKVVCDRFSLSMTETKETVVPSFVRRGFRNFKLTMRKAK